jgi:16S rRNA G527 N7-methylase RsmG
VFEFVFLIPIMGIGLGFFAVWTEHQRKMIRLRIEELNASKDARGVAPEQSREVKELRERVSVLERIVTDGGYDLATKIEALRDERPTIERPVEAERLS